MKQLLIEEMKRAIMLLERNNTLKPNWRENNYMEVYRDVAELKNLLKSVRKHSVILEKEEIK
jgi:hypothetical protein